MTEKKDSDLVLKIKKRMDSISGERIRTADIVAKCNKLLDAHHEFKDRCESDGLDCFPHIKGQYTREIEKAKEMIGVNEIFLEANEQDVVFYGEIMSLISRLALSSISSSKNELINPLNSTETIT